MSTLKKIPLLFIMKRRGKPIVLSNNLENFGSEIFFKALLFARLFVEQRIATGVDGIDGITIDIETFGAQVFFATESFACRLVK